MSSPRSKQRRLEFPDNMATPTFRQIPSRLTLPGAGSETLRKIGCTWSVGDVAIAIPYHLHPRGQHRANHWYKGFQDALEIVSRNCNGSELEVLREYCQRVVDTRRHKNPHKCNWLTANDLKAVNRTFLHKSAMEGNLKGRRAETGVGGRFKTEWGTRF